MEFIITSRPDVGSGAEDVVNNMMLAGALSEPRGPGMSEREIHRLEESRLHKCCGFI